MRHINDEGLALIKAFESFSAVPYRCPAGVLTIGYGHTGPNVAEGRSVTIQQAEELLVHDLQNSERAVLRLISRTLSDNQFAALVSFAFNAGSGSLQRSTLRMECNRYDDKAVPAQLLKWVYVGTRVMTGLKRRRRAEAELYAYR
jgi:lysozyme